MENEEFELEVRKGYSNIYDQLEALSLWLKCTLEEICHHDNFVSTYQLRKKSIDSLLDKVNKKKKKNEYELNNFQDVINHIDDLVGSRIMVFLPSKISEFHDFIMTWKRVKVNSITIHSYNDEINRNEVLVRIKNSLKKKRIPWEIAENKAGYFGVHYILEPKPVDTFYETSHVKLFHKFELQLRTLTHHAWSEVQHKAIYKHKNTNPDFDENVAKLRFADLADQVNSFDRKLEELSQKVFASPTVKISMEAKQEISKVFKPLQDKISLLISRQESGDIDVPDFKIEARRLLESNDFRENVDLLRNKVNEKTLSADDIYAALELGELYSVSQSAEVQ